MNGHERTEHPADDLFEVERRTHTVDPDSELGRAMAQARETAIAEDPAGADDERRS